MTKNCSKAIKYIVSAFVAVLLLYVSFKDIKWDDFISGLKACRWGYIVVSMLAGILAFYLRGLRWRQILLPVDDSITRSAAFNAVNIGYLANFVFPRIGEFVRCGYITKNSAPEEAEENSAQTSRKASYEKVLGTVVLERSWDMMTMFIFLFALLAFKWQEFGGFFKDQMWIPLSAKVSFSLWWIVAVALVAFGALICCMVRFRDKSPVLMKVSRLFHGLMQGFGSCLKMKDKWGFIFITLMIWGLYWLMSAATMWALPDLDSLGIADALFLMLAGSLGWLVPVPGGFGAFHFVVALALSTTYGIPFESGIVFATLSHESQAITMLLCGGASYFWETFRK